MPDNEREATWKVAAGLLEAARAGLPDSDESKLGLYREFLDVNELGLAFDWLVNAAETQSAPLKVWERLWSAATTMELDKDSYPHAEAAELVRRHLLT